jgi:predicted DNA repair protein MutK
LLQRYVVRLVTASRARLDRVRSALFATATAATAAAAAAVLVVVVVFVGIATSGLVRGRLAVVCRLKGLGPGVMGRAGSSAASLGAGRSQASGSAP